MKKYVSVDELIKIARDEYLAGMRSCNRGDSDMYNYHMTRVDGMMSLISVSSIETTDDFHEEWEKFYGLIYR